MSSVEIKSEVIRIAGKGLDDDELFKSYADFAIHCLNALRPEMSANARKWLELAIRNRNGDTTPEEMMRALSEVGQFTSRRGEAAHSGVNSREGAIAYLLRYALYHKSAPWRPDKADIEMALEAFIDIFTEVFGRERTVLTALTSSFN